MLGQRGVIPVQPQVPEFAKFGQIGPNPLDGTQVSARFDFRLSPSHTAFARYTHDGSGIFGPTGFSALSPQFPSSWARQRFWADQSLGALTSVLAPNLVNDLRFSYFFFSGQDAPPTAAECPGACLGLGAPITMPDIGILIGSSQSDSMVSRRYGLLESLSWQKGSHRLPTHWRRQAQIAKKRTDWNTDTRCKFSGLVLFIQINFFLR